MDYRLWINDEILCAITDKNLHLPEELEELVLFSIDLPYFAGSYLLETYWGGYGEWSFTRFNLRWGDIEIVNCLPNTEDFKWAVFKSKISAVYAQGERRPLLTIPLSGSIKHLTN